MCKGNNAATVKTISPHNNRGTLPGREEVCRNNQLFSAVWRTGRVDISSTIGIIMFTQIPTLTPGNANAEAIVQRRLQARSAAPAGNPQPAPADRDRRTIPQPGVFRRPRFSSGQIRDVAPGRERWTFHLGGSRGVWILTPIVLSGPVCFSGGRTGGPSATEARTQESSQAYTGDHGIPSRGASAGSFTANFATSHLSPGEIPCGRSSAKYRAWTGAQSKKTTRAGISPDSRQELIDDYELLRNHILSHAAGRNPTPGLVLFLDQGMAAWMRARSYCRKTHPETPPPLSASPPCSLDVRGEVASILAAIILNRQLEACT